jgi:hypothetical protein
MNDELRDAVTAAISRLMRTIGARTFAFAWSVDDGSIETKSASNAESVEDSTEKVLRASANAVTSAMMCLEQVSIQHSRATGTPVEKVMADALEESNQTLARCERTTHVQH